MEELFGKAGGWELTALVKTGGGGGCFKEGWLLRVFGREIRV